MWCYPASVHLRTDFSIDKKRNMIKRDEFPFGADQMIKLKLEAFLISLVRGSKDIQPSSRNEIHEQSRRPPKILCKSE